MRQRTRAAGVLAAAVLLAPTVLAGPADAAPGGAGALSKPSKIAGAGATQRAGEPVTVTLITGDTVTVRGDRVSVQRGPGRGDVTFATSRAGDHLRVIPSDALPLLRAGALDARLFDVTTLIGFGYDDRRKDLPLIVTGPAGASGARAATAGVTAVRAIPGGSAVRAAKSEITSVWRTLSADVRSAGTARGAAPSKIWLDGLRKPTLKESVPQIGAPAAWAAGLDGAGVKVAVVDSGVDSTHPDLAGRVAAAQNFTTVDSDTLDRVGHGTHVAATIGSTGAAPGGYKGVAPGVSLLSAKVCVDYGCEESWMLAGMQWAAEQGAKVINMSLGGGDTPEQDPIEAAVERITAEFGALFVISAGNSGRDQSIGSPGSTDAALTVGAVDKSDNLAPFSSRGPRVGDAGLKPDITAPGVEIVAANSKDGFLGQPGATHTTLSGTSMAAPHVAGSAAILAQQHPTWGAVELKAALMGSATPKADVGVFAQGAGRVDVARAITQTVTASPASVSFGRQSWPHDDDTPDTRTLTYRNTGTADVTLALSLTGVPAGLFSLSAPSVTVPAGGTASVTLTSDTRAAVPDGRHGGHVVATAGEARVVTPFAVEKEVESYNVTVDRVGRNGQPVSDGVVFLVNQETGETFDLGGDEPTVTARVPKGTYGLVAWIYEQRGENEFETSMVVDPALVVDRPVRVTADARAAKPVSITVPKADAAGVLALAEVVFAIGDGDFTSGFGLLGNSFEGMYVGQPDPNERRESVSSNFTYQLVKGPLPDDGPLTPSPYAYFLGYKVEDHLPSGFTRRVTDRELATLEASYANQGIPDATTGAFGRFGGDGFAWAAVLPVALPSTRTEYYGVQPTLTWSRELMEGGFDELQNWISSPPTAFTAGRTTRERINAAVFGPGFEDSEYTSTGRWENQFVFVPAIHSPAGDWTGFPQADTGRTVVERNGQVIADVPQRGVELPSVPPEVADFKVRVESSQPPPNRLSTRFSGEWTFRSGKTGGDLPTPFAVSAVRFAPPLDLNNVAPAGKLWLVPVEVQRHPNSAAGRARTLTVEVSYDDGATWRTAPVLRAGQRGVVVLNHPAGAGFVSLRAASTDTAGNTVKQTIIRAYQIG